jgi:hypothetical protein
MKAPPPFSMVLTSTSGLLVHESELGSQMMPSLDDPVGTLRESFMKTEPPYPLRGCSSQTNVKDLKFNAWYVGCTPVAVDH